MNIVKSSKAYFTYRKKSKQNHETGMSLATNKHSSMVSNGFISSTQSNGFTIVELLVVIVVIGILAAITIVSYTGVSQKAIAASLQSDLSAAKTKLQMYQTEHSSYPTTMSSPDASGTLCPSAPNIDSTYCIKPSSGNTFRYKTNTNHTTFGLTATSTNSTAYSVTDSTAVAAGALSTLNVSAGANGTVNTAVNGFYSSSSTPIITATPTAAYVVFGSWSGSAGCNGVTTASYAITMDSDKTCMANFVAGPNWIAGLASTAMAGKFIRNADLGSTYAYETSTAAVTSPQGSTGLDPKYLSNMSLVSPQTNPGVDFSAYPAQNACKAIGGRLPNMQELLAIYTGRSSYGNNFNAGSFPYYYSSTEYSDSAYAYFVSFADAQTPGSTKTFSRYVRCVAG